jgi:hypothetical protein
MQVTDNSELDQSGTQILHPGSRALFRYWESLRAERACPTRDEVDLHQIVDVVPDMMILEKNILNTGWQYRLAGTRLCEFFQGELTGRDALSGWDNFERDVVSKCLEVTLQRLQPSLIRMRFISDLGNTVAAEMIALPIYTSKDNRVQIIGGFFPFVAQNRNAVDHLVRRELVSARMIWTEHEQGDTLLENVGRKASSHLRVIQGGLQ